MRPAPSVETLRIRFDHHRREAGIHIIIHNYIQLCLTLILPVSLINSNNNKYSSVYILL